MEMKKKTPPHFRPSPILPGVPIGLARSALFPVARPDNGGAVVYIFNRRVPMAAQRGEKLGYRGPRLNQHHALAWQAVLIAAEGMDAMDGRAFEVSPDMLLRDMGGQGGDTSQRERLLRWLVELTHARIHYTTRLQKFAGPLLAHVEHTPTGRLSLRLHPSLREILRNEILRNDLARKARLGLNALALWLHDFIATHLRPPADTVERLRLLSGSALKLPQFRVRLRTALALLTGPDGLVIEGEIDRFDRLMIARKAPTRVVILVPEGEPAQVKKRAPLPRSKPRQTPTPTRQPCDNPLRL